MTDANGVTDIRALQRTTREIADQYRRSSVAPGDIVMSIGPSFGKVMVVPVELDGANLTQGTARLAPDSQVDARWLYWFLQSKPAREFWESSVGGATFRALNLGPLGATPVPEVPVEEQRRIADFLDDQVARIDRLHAETIVQRTLVEERRSAAIVRTLLAGGTLLGRAPWFTGLPDTIAAVPLRAMWNVIDCKHRTPNYQDEGIPVVSPGDIKPGRLDLSCATRFVNETDYLDLADDLRRCRRGDLVYSRNASAGIPAYVDTDEPFTMGQDVCRITSRQNSQLFLAYALQHLTGPQLDSVRVGSTFTRINVDEIKNLRIPNYDVETQQGLADECDRSAAHHDEWLAALNARSGQLEERKRALITAVVTGELDVTTAQPIRAGAV